MLALAVGITVVRLRALPALGQVVAVLAAVEALEDGDPEGLHAGLFRGFLDDASTWLRWWLTGGGGVAVVTRRASTGGGGGSARRSFLFHGFRRHVILCKQRGSRLFGSVRSAS